VISIHFKHIGIFKKLAYHSWYIYDDELKSLITENITLKSISLCLFIIVTIQEIFHRDCNHALVSFPHFINLILKSVLKLVIMELLPLLLIWKPLNEACQTSCQWNCFTPHYVLKFQQNYTPLKFSSFLLKICIIVWGN